MILEAKKIKNEKIINIQEQVAKIADKLSFVIIQVGDNFASNKYIKNKIKLAEELNMEAQVINFQEDVLFEDLKDNLHFYYNPNPVNDVFTLELKYGIGKLKLPHGSSQSESDES